MRLTRQIVLLSAFLLPFSIYAENDKAPVNVSADNVEHEESSGSVVYSGNVEVSQGAIQINSDRLTIKRDENNTIITATGSPVKFSSKDASGQSIQGEAASMNYTVDNKMLLMHGQPLRFKASQGGGKQFNATASSARYDIAQQSLTLSGIPISFRHSQPDSKPLSGTASTADYNLLTKKLVLSGNAELEQDGNTIKNDRIVFDLMQQSVVAGQKAQAKERVQTTIQLNK